MSVKLAKRTENVKFSPIREIFDLASRTPGLTRLEVGQPDFHTPAYIRDASKNAIDGGFIGYTPTNGLQETRDAVCMRLKKDYQLEYDPNSEVAITIGASGALYLALRALLDPGDEVLRPNPGFASYDEIVKDADGVPVQYGLDPDADFKVDFAEVERLINKKTKAIIVNSPGNPVGNVLSKAEIQEFVDLAEKHDLVILSDEAYDKVIFDIEHIPVALLANDRSRVLTIGSGSKNYAMTGYRVGFAAGAPELVREIVKFQSLSSICPSYIGQKSYAHALTGIQDETSFMRKEYQKRRDYFVNELNNIPGFKCFVPNGAFYAFTDISEINKDDWAFCRELIRDVKVTAIPGSSFGKNGTGYVRFSFATSMTELEKAIEKLRAHYA